MAVDECIEAFIRPRGIAIVGASKTPGKLGHILATNILCSGYEGPVYLVNPAGGELEGHPVYPSVETIPDRFDLAVILVPADATPTILEQCGSQGARGAILAAAGFREAGSGGRALEDRCVRVAHHHGMRLLGPNCLGIADNIVPFNTTFLPPPGPPCGPIALLSQSGAMCAAAIDKSLQEGPGFSRLVSLGNQADVTESDFLEAFASDAHTRTVMLYLEGIQDGRRFIASASAFCTEKPLVVLHVGRSDAGRLAATSHTGSLAGTPRMIDAACRRAGATVAGTTREFFDYARTFANAPLPKGNRIGVLSNAGGPGVAAVDAFGRHQLVCASLAEDTRRRLDDVLPEAAVKVNPVDMLATANGEQYAHSLIALLEDDGVDGVLVLLPAPPHVSPESVIQATIPTVKASKKPVLYVPFGGHRLQKAVGLLREENIAAFDYPEEAVSAMGALWRFASRHHRCEAAPHRLSPSQRTAIEELLVDQETLLSAERAIRLVASSGIAVIPSEACRSVEEALEIAERFGYPVVLKADARGLAHKTDLGGIVLGIRSGDALRRAAHTVRSNVTRHLGDEAFRGFLIQPVADRGRDLVVGGLRDPQFGPAVMFGRGGTEVELEDDVAFAVAPVSDVEAEDLIDRTRVGRTLHAHRGRAEADRAAVVRAILNVGALMADQSRISACDINPLRVYAHGEGAMALDVKVHVNSAKPENRDSS